MKAFLITTACIALWWYADNMALFPLWLNNLVMIILLALFALIVFALVKAADRHGR